MSVTVTISTDEAEARAAETVAKIAEYEQFLVDAPALLQAATRDEVRGGRAGKVKKLQEHKVIAESELPRLRARLLAFQEITAEHQAAAVEARRAKVREQGAEIDEEEREALHEVVKALRAFNVATVDWWHVLDRRTALRRTHAVDLEGYPESALDAIDVTGVPRTLPQVFERIHKAVFDPGNVGDARHLQGWDRFV